MPMIDRIYESGPLEWKSRAMILRDIICDHHETPAVVSTVPRLLSPRDAAKAMSISERSLWSLTNEGAIPAVRMGRSVRYDAQDLQRWIDRNKSIGSDPSAAA